jgi:hypothetical protein
MSLILVLIAWRCWQFDVAGRWKSAKPTGVPRVRPQSGRIQTVRTQPVMEAWPVLINSSLMDMLCLIVRVYSIEGYWYVWSIICLHKHVTVWTIKPHKWNRDTGVNMLTIMLTIYCLRSWTDSYRTSRTTFSSSGHVWWMPAVNLNCRWDLPFLVSGSLPSTSLCLNIQKLAKFGEHYSGCTKRRPTVSHIVCVEGVCACVFLKRICKIVHDFCDAGFREIAVLVLWLACLEWRAWVSWTFQGDCSFAIRQNMHLNCFLPPFSP